MRENQTLQEVVEEDRKKNDFSKIRKNVEDLTNSLNQMLIEDVEKNKKL